MIRPVDIDKDVQSVVAMYNAFEPEDPLAPEQFVRWVTHNPPGRVNRKVVFTDEDDHPVGYCGITHEPADQPGKFDILLLVDEYRRKQGIGSSLYADGLDFLRRNEATCLVMTCHEADADSLRFAQQRGFRIDRHQFESVLDLTAFDQRPYTGLIPSFEAQGFCFTSLLQLGVNDENIRKLFDLNRATVLDIPGNDGSFLDYDSFKTFVAGADWFNPQGQLFAIHGEIWAGMSAVRIIVDHHSAYNLMTGVRREYRGRHLALALKLFAIRYATSQGATYMRTHNDSFNVPILAINRKLGYQPQPGRYLLLADI